MNYRCYRKNANTRDLELFLILFHHTPKIGLHII
nr:MAG TPA: hypothetical protein [Caudoviricetes sp.]